MRAAVYRRVQAFSAREMNRFGISSLVTRNVYDVKQVQLCLQLTLTLLIMAAVLSVGGAEPGRGSRAAEPGGGWRSRWRRPAAAVSGAFDAPSGRDVPSSHGRSYVPVIAGRHFLTCPQWPKTGFADLRFARSLASRTAS